MHRHFWLTATFIISISCGFFLRPINCPSSGEKSTIKILCYNIHHASPPSKPDSIDLDAIASVIIGQQPDIVALQEVDVYTRRSGPHNQAEVLAQKTGLTSYFIKAIDYDGGEYGVAILSRYPMTERKRYPLPVQTGTGGEPRVLGTATIELPGDQQIVFACTHLDAQRLPVNRMLQIDAIRATLKGATLPVIIAGDFNAPPGSSEILTLDSLFTRTCDVCPFTIPVDQPRKAIDFIAFSPATHFKVIQHEVIPERYASDHLPLVATLQIITR